MSKHARRGAAEADEESTVTRFTRGLRRFTDAAIGVANTAVDLSVTAAQVVARTPQQRAAVAKAGALLRQAREAAGLSMQEVGAAVDLSDPHLLELAESGKIALPFELVLRLAAVLGRRDPMTFALQLTRASNPGVWEALERLGVGKLVVQSARERAIANIVRGNDAARGLSDADFQLVAEFTKRAFDMAVEFRVEESAKSQRSASAKARKRAR